MYDAAQIRFKHSSFLADNLYVRQDGTLSYFFNLDYIETLFESVGFEIVSKEYVMRKTINLKKSLNVTRVFVQARFKKKTT